MAFKTNCPKCGSSLQVPDAAVGKAAKCPACGHVFTIPKPSANTSASASPPQQQPARPAAPAAAQQPALRQVNCPGCGKMLQVADSAIGKLAKCPACSHLWRIPMPPVVKAEVVHEAQKSPVNSAFDELMADTVPVTAAVIPAAKQVAPTPIAPRFIEKKRRRSSSDDDLSVFEWIVCIFLPIIGCICGIAYLTAGKPKAGKMLGVSFLSAIIILLLILAFLLGLASLIAR
jgi:predicted Zn finger-like uncharacterized protein